jgi:serine/threonine-protein kinase SRPK3
VALKIVVARLTEGNGEAAILERLTTSPRDHPGASHIVQLYDYFQIQGPNGTHQVLVMDVLASASSLRGTKLIHQQSRSVCHQLLLGLDYLQQEAVVHGGKYMSLCISVLHNY